MKRVVTGFWGLNLAFQLGFAKVVARNLSQSAFLATRSQSLNPGLRD